MVLEFIGLNKIIKKEDLGLKKEGDQPGKQDYYQELQDWSSTDSMARNSSR